MVSPAPQSASSPDLAVKRVELDEDCSVWVTLANLGGAPVSAAAYDTSPTQGVSLSIENTTGKHMLADIDPARSLLTPGGTLRYQYAYAFVKQGQSKAYSFVLNDPGGVSGEVTGTQDNNRWGQLLTCQLPDIAVTAIQPVGQYCKQVKVTVKNLGPGYLSLGNYGSDGAKIKLLHSADASANDGTPIPRYLRFDQVDPGRALRTPNGEVTCAYTWDSLASNRLPGAVTASVLLNESLDGKVFDANLANNQRSEILSCGQP